MGMPITVFVAGSMTVTVSSRMFATYRLPLSGFHQKRYK